MWSVTPECLRLCWYSLRAPRQRCRYECFEECLLSFFWTFSQGRREQSTTVEQRKPKPRAEFVRICFFLFFQFLPKLQRFTKIFKRIFEHHQIIAKFINLTWSTAVIGQLLFYLNRIFSEREIMLKRLWNLNFWFIHLREKKGMKNLSTQVVTRAEQSKMLSQSLSSLVVFVIYVVAVNLFCSTDEILYF